jgi:hypothetical protein
LTNTATGGEQAVSTERRPVAERIPRPDRLARLIVAHWQFTLIAAAAVLARIVVMVGYPPILWFSDSYNYITDAVTHIPDEVRPNGYPFFLDLLLPAHSDFLIGLLQAAMGVAMGVAIYALLRHRGLPWWGAALPTLPVLFDAYELHLEHMITSDPLFTFLVTIAVVMVCWRDRPSVPTIAVAGLLIGYATLVRSVGEPLLVVMLVGLLARRVGWRRLVAFAVAGIVPIVAYMAWFNGTYHQFALTESSGPFLYSRVSTFAECSKMKNLAADLKYLCDPHPPQDRPPAGEYIWADNDYPVNGQTTYTPLYQATRTNPNTALRFTAAMNKQTKQFAEDAIESQPLAYATAVTDDIWHTFGWFRQPDPNNWYGNGPNFQFTSTAIMNQQVPWYATPQHLPGTPYHKPHSHTVPWCPASCQQGDQGAAQTMRAERDFDGGGLGFTHSTQPWTRLLETYQRYVFLPGMLLGVIALLGAAGLVVRWRRWGGTGLLPWLVGALLIVLPPLTAGFSYRYVLAAAPLACLAAGLAFVPRKSAELSMF